MRGTETTPTFLMRALCALIVVTLMHFSFAAAVPSLLAAQDRPRAAPAAAPEPEEESDPEEYMLTLHVGEEAPFDGTLFSVAAAARLLADLELTQARCDLEVGRRVRLSEAEMQLRIDTERARFEALEYRHTELMRIRDQQIEFLTGQLRPEQWYESGEFWFVIGLLSGVALTVAAGYAVGQAN